MVTEVDCWAFGYCSNLTSVVIPAGVTSIGDGAFIACTGLTNLTLANTITTIGPVAFDGCSELSTVTIPASVTNIGYCAFGGCAKLIEIRVDVLNRFYASENGVLFNKDKTTLIQCSGGKTGPYVIPNGVTNIDLSAFAFCENLTGATIPNGVTSIGNWAFEGCSGLTAVTVPNSVTSIGDRAFAECSGLTNVTIADGVTTLGGAVFAGCYGLREITIPSSVTWIWGVSSGGVGPPLIISAFMDCFFTSVYFAGDAPIDIFGTTFYYSPTNATIYYLPGTTGWGPIYGGRPTALWSLPTPVILKTAPNFGAQTNGFGFRISWATNDSVVIEASTILSPPSWVPLSTNTLLDGWFDFTDSDWKDHPSRFYRVRGF